MATLTVGDVVPQQESSLPGSHRRVWLGVFVACVIGAMVGYAVYIAIYGVNVIFWDEWAWGPLIHTSDLTLHSFWVQHTEERLFFPSIIAAALIHITDWNDFAFFYLSAAFMGTTLLLIVRVFWDDIRGNPGWWIPVPFVVLTLAQYQNTLWAFQIAWPLVLVALVGALVALLEVRPSMLRLGLAIALGVLASYSSLQGLLVWPAGLIILTSRGRTRQPAIVWSAAGLVVTVIYFVGFDPSTTGSASLHQILANLPTVVGGFLISLGSVIPTITAGISVVSANVLSGAIGAVLLAAGIVVALSWWKEGRPGGPKRSA